MKAEARWPWSDERSAGESRYTTTRDLTGFNLRPSDYELDPLDRLDYVELGFQAEFGRSSYVEIGWNPWGVLPHLLPHAPRNSGQRKGLDAVALHIRPNFPFAERPVVDPHLVD